MNQILEFQRYFNEPITNLRNLNHRGNNLLFEVKAGNSYLLKKYSDRVPSSMIVDKNWSRGQIEFNTLNYLWKSGIREIPEPIKFDYEKNTGIYSYEQGRVLNPLEIRKQDIEAAVDFLLKIHGINVEDKKNFPCAFSACLCLQEYVEVIDRRFRKISDLKDYDLDENLEDKAKKISSTLTSRISELKKEFYEKTRGFNLREELPIEEQVLTPNDFGFHNILVHDNRYIFLDFEYFGRDDPARQVLQFLHHDKSQEIKQDLRDYFLKLYLDERGTESIKKRIELTDSLIGMDWLLVYLNVLSKDYRTSMEKIHGTFEKETIEERINKAENKLKNLDAIRNKLT